MKIKRIADDIAGILNDAIKNELHAHRVYAHVANHCNNLGLFGAESFFRKESADELSHYHKLADFLLDRGAVPIMPTMETITDTFSDLGEALVTGYKAETALETLYVNWYSKVLPKDPVTANFLLQFLEIQQSSVGEYGDLIARYELMADGDDILVFDQELGTK